ncbi:T-cell-interacting, activating receptor on myeloid cells protein 1-like isoform X2 [Notamacropus eugenii]|uniref:T-cell-interacting, activating receptor on myeloid cells protein 1-like isoform X2 n=1 Tax=Notamacropus eugenii TaxID=9315 RepID=UPI003B66EF81
MIPAVTSLLWLGLCLSQKITAPEGTLPRPSIRAVPSSVVPIGAEVVFYCRGPQGNKSFQLWKDEEFFLQIRSSKEEIKFSSTKDNYGAGNYSCRYSQGPHMSEFSAPLQLVVTGFFSKPSLHIQPGTMVAVGETVILTCQVPALQSRIPKLMFFLLKAGVATPLQYQSVEGKMANFTLPSVKAEDAGNYSCIYSEKQGKRRASDPSKVHRLEVTGKKNAHPQNKENRLILIATVSCVSFLLLLCLLAFLCHRCRIKHKSSCGDTPGRTSDSAGVPQPLCLTSLPPEDITYEDVSKGRQIETWASESEDSQGVTYSQLNTAALDEGQRAPTCVPPEPSVYATLALH